MNFLSSFFSFILGPFSSAWFFGNFLNKASLYVFAGCGSSIALKSGNFNLGGEAQIYAPALVTSYILSSNFAYSSNNPWTLVFLFFLALFFAIITGALLSAIPGFFKAKFNTSELLTSFLLSAAIIPVVDYLISGPLRDSSKNLLATKIISENFRLTSILKPSFLNPSFFIAILVVFCCSFFIEKSKAGFRLTTAGKSYEFAKYAGFNVGKITFFSMLASGALHGLTGFFAITGTWVMCHQGFSNGMGWAALAIALIARANPRFIFFSALFYAWIEDASDIYNLSNAQSFDTSSLIQGLVFLFITAKIFPRKFFEKIFKKNGGGAGSNEVVGKKAACDELAGKKSDCNEMAGKKSPQRGQK